MAFRVPERIYRTVDGRLVQHGHPDAAFLAFPEGEELSDEEATRFGVRKLLATNPPHNKLGSPPLDKRGPQPEDKSADVAELRKAAQVLGIKVDGRWSTDRIRQEIDVASRRPQEIQEES